MQSHVRKTSLRLLGPLALAFALVGTAWAQDTTPAETGQNPDTMGAMRGQGMSGMKGAHMQGMHAMPATVDSVDASSGLVGVTAGGMQLKLHFPPPALAGLKAGDRITVHMGFSKP